MGFIQPSGGTVNINGVSVVESALETKKYSAYIPETVMLYPTLSGIENLEFFSSLAGFSYEKDESSSFLSKAGLQNTAHNQRVGGYSKGM